MAFERVEQEIDRIDATDAGGPRKRVVILGAGMAGLVSAYELSRLGHEVLLVEAQRRVGGRVCTKRFANHDYHELGAMRIPDNHAHTLHYIDRFGLEVRPFINHHGDPDTFYHFRGITTRHSDYHVSLLPAFSLGPKDRQLLHKAPANALMAVLGPAIEEVIHGRNNREALFAEGPMTDYVEELDKLTLREYLGKYLDTEDAVELAGVATGLEVWWDKAASMFVREEIAQADVTGFLEIVGGFDLLPRAIMTALEQRANVTARLGTEVAAIHNQPDGVQLVLREAGAEDGSKVERLDADLVICTIPFPVLRAMVVTGVSTGKQRAIRTYHYAGSTKVLFSCAERFWETDYSIFGGGSQTDLINRQIYYPSDPPPGESLSAPTEKGSVHSAFAVEWRGKPAAVAKRSGPLVGSYVWDSDARRLGNLPHSERAAVVARCVAEIHPEILRGGMILEQDSIFWDSEPWARGAFSFMRPGDLRFNYRNAIKAEGRLYFAGEHCSLDQAWIQGAIRSALTAVEAIVTRKD